MVVGQHGFRCVLTVTDQYSRYVKFYPLKTKGTEEVAEAFTKYVTDFGIPAALVMDNGGEFTSQLFKTLCQEHNIQTGYTTPYHPRGNSVTKDAQDPEINSSHPLPRTSSSLA